MSKTEFLSNYWQKKPLLIRNALPDFRSPFTPDELAGLALEESVESRLITGKQSQASQPQSWQLQHGPFQPEEFSSLPPSHWTLLVQGVDLWVDEVRTLINHFDFLPRWRIDDVMVSYAVKGGSVGPHFDYYDVFLIQGAGNRLWQLGDCCDQNTPLLDNTPLKILRDFKPNEEWLLQPGDMLYLPPCIAHHGVAQDDDCMTFSVGFRSPTTAEVFNDLALELLSHTEYSHQYLQDPPLAGYSDINTLEPGYIDQIQQQLQAVLKNRELLEDWFARYMTKPKNEQDIDENLLELEANQLDKAVEDGSIKRISPNARYIKTSQGNYVNGEKLD